MATAASSSPVTETGAFDSFRWEEIEALLGEPGLTPGAVTLPDEDFAGGTELVLGDPQHKAAFVRALFARIWLACNETPAGSAEPTGPVRWEDLPLAVRDFYVRASRACCESDSAGEESDATPDLPPAADADAGYAECAGETGQDAEDAEYAEEGGQRAADQAARAHARARALGRLRVSAARRLPSNWPLDLSPWSYGQRQRQHQERACGK